jgi:hypothetical protein
MSYCERKGIGIKCTWTTWEDWGDIMGQGSIVRGVISEGANTENVRRKRGVDR